MSFPINARLNSFHEAASVISHANGIGDNTVINMARNNGQAEFAGRKCQLLGFRSDEFKAANRDTRTEFIKAVCREYGSFKAIPEAVKAAMKLDDFGLEFGDDGKISKVNSTKPLTARRIKLVVDAVKNYNDTHSMRNEIKADDEAKRFGDGTWFKKQYVNFIVKTEKKLDKVGGFIPSLISADNFIKHFFKKLGNKIEAKFEDKNSPAYHIATKLKKTLEEEFKQGNINPNNSKAAETLHKFLKEDLVPKNGQSIEDLQVRWLAKASNAYNGVPETF